MDWNSCLTIGCGEGVALAIRRSGAQSDPTSLVVPRPTVGLSSGGDPNPRHRRPESLFRPCFPMVFMPLQAFSGP